MRISDDNVHATLGSPYSSPQCLFHECIVGVLLKLSCMTDILCTLTLVSPGIYVNGLRCGCYEQWFHIIFMIIESHNPCMNNDQPNFHIVVFYAEKHHTHTHTPKKSIPQCSLAAPPPSLPHLITTTLTSSPSLPHPIRGPII